MNMKILLSSFLLIFFVSGCGSDSDDQTEEITCSESLSCPSGGTLGGFFEWLSGACTTSTTCSSDQGWPDSDSPAPDWDSLEHQESEPNDSLEEALPIFVEEPGRLAHVSGKISPSDSVDYVAFSTAYNGTVSIYICKIQTCEGMVYSGDAAYLDILDANGNTIASTAASLDPSDHRILMTFTPRQVYFVRIVKDNLTAGEFEYRFLIANGIPATWLRASASGIALFE